MDFRKTDFGFKQQSVGETTYLVMELGKDSVIDSFAMNMMARNRMTNIVPVQIVQRNDIQLVQFNITGLVKVNGWLSGPRPKKEVLSIFNSILNVFEEADAYMLDMEHLLLEWEYLYLDRQGNCMLLYLPFDHVSDKDKIVFLQEIVSRVQPDYQERDPYLFDILNAFSRGGIRKLSDFREIIKKNADVQTVGYQEVQQEEAAVMQDIEGKGQIPSEHEEREVMQTAGKKERKKTSISPKIPVINIPGREPGAKFVSPEAEADKEQDSRKKDEKKRVEKKKDEKNKNEKNKNEKKGFFKSAGRKQNSFLIPKKQKEETESRESVGNETADRLKPMEYTGRSRQDGLYESYEHTVMMQEPVRMEKEDEGTVMLEPAGLFMQISASLTSRKDGMVYRIDRERMMLGSGASADICIRSNHAISRSHAVISYVNGEFYAEDNQSKNGTFINGRRLQPGVREPVYDGMVIKLADEEFKFSKD